MVDFTNLKDYLKTDVFLRSDLKKTAAINHYVEVAGDYNTKVITFSNQEVIEGIFLSYEILSKKFDRFGQYNDSSLIFLVPYDTVISPHDTIEVYDEEFNIVGIKDFIGGQESSLGRKIFLKKKEGDL